MNGIRRKIARVVRGAAALVLLALPTSSQAARQVYDAPLLLGGGKPPRRAPVELDPWLPTGAPVYDGVERPASPQPPACSLQYPVCVHTQAGVHATTPLLALQALERAYERLVLVLDLPRPLSDYEAGGTADFDLYLEPNAPSPLRVGHDPPAPGYWDRASAFCVVSDAPGEELERAATLCLAEAIALGVDAAATPEVRRAYATHVWWTVGSPTNRDWLILDNAQAHPERSLVGLDVTATTTGMFFEYVDVLASALGPTGLSTAFLSAASGKTAPSSLRWDNEPDVLDVLRHTLDERTGRVAALFGDLAVRRAFLGSRDEGSHWPWLAWAGDFGRVRFDWVLPWSSLPRRVLATRPLEPTGSVYFYVPLDGPLKAADTLGFRAEWEGPSSFVWSLVRVGADGAELSRLDVPFQERGSSAEQRLTSLEGAAAVIVVGTNLGGVDLAHPYDPDIAPYEPAGCTVYLARL